MVVGSVVTAAGSTTTRPRTTTIGGTNGRRRGMLWIVRLDAGAGRLVIGRMRVIQSRRRSVSHNSNRIRRTELEEQ